MVSENEKQRRRVLHQDFAEILGVDHFSQATRKLNDSILLDFAERLGKNICNCGNPVSLDNFTIGHIKPWRRCFTRVGNKDLFWNVDNIVLEHREHNLTHDDFRTDTENIRIYPTEHECNKNVKDESMRNQLNFDHDLLGMEFGKANHQLCRKIMYGWCCQLGLNKCYKGCPKKIIDRIEDWTVEHKNPWNKGKTKEEKNRLFYSLENIAYSHKRCNCGSSNAGKGESGYYGVGPYFNKSTGYNNWRARISVGGKLITLKHGTDTNELAEWYDMAILKYCGGQGPLNFPEKQEEYEKTIALGWHEDPRCKICGAKHFGLGYCRTHHYEFCGGKEKRKERYLKGQG
jgi:hypothetical protein